MGARQLPNDEQQAASTAEAATQPQAPPRDAWHDGPSESAWEDVAPPRAAGATEGGCGDREGDPAALRPGQRLLSLGEDDGNVWDEATSYAPGPGQPGNHRAETNPFLQRKPVSHGPHVPPVKSFSKMDLDGASQGSNPWQALSVTQDSPPAENPPPAQILPDEADMDPWASNEPEATLADEGAAAASPALVSLPSEDESSAWNDVSRTDQVKPLAEPPPATAMSDELLGDRLIWDDLDSLDKGEAKVTYLSAGLPAQLDDWNLIDADSSSSRPNQAADEASDTDAKPAALPPGPEGVGSRWMPSRQPVDGKSETYQVKNIRWHDDKSGSNPRTSPILIQNKNGPCPLVALVNALTLTTPADMPDTALVQVLRLREQVSLSLVLDAVFDELMSPRRTNSEDSLPDVTDLYSFLQSLHTGMTVNPRFIPTPKMVTAYKRTSLTHLRPEERGDLIPGTFENTMEMSLYATFSVPLIHGWLPHRSDPSYEALERQAASYEEVQNLLFREEELEDKLSNPSAGLSETEQQLYQDIMTIKMFLSASATQLTPWGLEVIAKAMRPGTFAILFRNDHFSTLYCHPQTMQLLSLVTDAGYGNHEGVVWESLVDVSGEHTEYLSGDFKVVGASSNTGCVGRWSGDDGGVWTTVQSRRGKGQQEDDQELLSPKREQEDRDLALALQLQEEEEQRHLQEQARRRRESILSEQYIEQQAQRPEPIVRGARRGLAGAGGTAPEQRSSGSVNVPVMTNPQPSESPQVVRPLVPPRRQGVSRRADSGGDAPPSYEQAAQDPAFVPPAGHPSHAGSGPAALGQTWRASAGPDGNGPRPQRPWGASGGRRRTVSPGMAPGSATGGSQGRDRECLVM